MVNDFGFIDRSNTNAEKYVLRQKLFSNPDVIPLWVADMDFATPQCVRDALQERLMHPVFGYEIMRKEAYEAQIGWISKHHDFQIEQEWLIYSPSVVASIGCAIRSFSDEGDEVIVQSPVYPPFYSMVKKNGRSLLLNPLKQDGEGQYHFDLEDLQNKITPKTKILLLCSPHNPVGRVWKRNELQELVEICAEHNIVIVSDEIHADIVYSPHVHVPTATLSHDAMERTVTLTGPGKTFNMAGFSISTVCIPSDRLRKAFQNETGHIHWGEGAVLSHAAFEAAYKHGEEWYQRLLEQLVQNQNRLIEWSGKYPQIKIRPPEGTYLAWMDCRALAMGDHELRDFFAQKAGLGLSPGLSFGKEGSGFMRLNFAHSPAVIDQALEKLSQALENL